MANGLYGKFREAALQAQVNLSTGAVKLLLVTSAYTPDLAADQFLSSVPGGGARVATSSALANKSFTLGVFDADDLTIASVTGSAVTYGVLFIDTGVDATSRLIACWDTATGLPLTPNGNNVDVVWSNGADKIFKI